MGASWLPRAFLASLLWPLGTLLSRETGFPENQADGFPTLLPAACLLPSSLRSGPAAEEEMRRLGPAVLFLEEAVEGQLPASPAVRSSCVLEWGLSGSPGRTHPALGKDGGKVPGPTCPFSCVSHDGQCEGRPSPQDGAGPGARAHCPLWWPGFFLRGGGGSQRCRPQSFTWGPLLPGSAGSA